MKWGDPNQPGRLDVNGVEWWACSPYPTWYRWDGDTLHAQGYGPADQQVPAAWA